MERKILLVGRISPEKGIHILLEAFQRLVEEEDSLRLIIIGPDLIVPMEVIVNISDSDMVSQLRRFYDTTVWKRLRTWLKNRYPRRLSWLRDTTYGGVLRAMVQGKMAERVRFVGFIPNEDLSRWYREADLLVLPSVYETFGMPLIEAMASGTPVLATRIGGIPEVVDDGRTGILVEPGSSAQLAQGIKSVIHDDVLLQQMGIEGRRRVVEKFSWEKTVDTLLQYYGEIVSTPPSPP
jgi:glycosyltransferase involved in cell wall biosynthesis